MRIRPAATLAGVTVALALCADAAPAQVAQSPGEAMAAEIQKSLPAGWTCTVISEKEKMGHPHGLEEPLFRIDFVNENLVFRFENPPEATKMVHPNLRLHFHPIADRARILRTIEAERMYSWAIPTLFAETKDYIVVTSPMWQNHDSFKVGTATWGAGVYTEEANRQIAPLLDALKKYFDTRR